MNNLEIAAKYREKGCNCSQTILCTYHQVCGMDENTAFKVAEGLGAGVAVQSLCGAASAMAMVIGYINSSGLKGNGASKGKTYQMVQIYMNQFKEKYGSELCSELKTNKISCAELINQCVLYIEEFMKDAEK